MSGIDNMPDNPQETWGSKLNKLINEIKELHDNKNDNNEIDSNIFSEELDKSLNDHLLKSKITVLDDLIKGINSALANLDDKWMEGSVRKLKSKIEWVKQEIIGKVFHFDGEQLLIGADWNAILIEWEEEEYTYKGQKWTVWRPKNLPDPVVINGEADKNMTNSWREMDNGWNWKWFKCWKSKETGKINVYIWNFDGHSSSGEWTMIYQDGERYEWEWKDWLENGLWTYFFENKGMYEWSRKGWKMDGSWAYIRANWNKLSGKWKEGFVNPNETKFINNSGKEHSIMWEQSTQRWQIFDEGDKHYKYVNWRTWELETNHHPQSGS